MAFITWRQTPASSVSASTIRPSSRSVPSVAGSIRWGASANRTSRELTITADGGGSNGSCVGFGESNYSRPPMRTGSSSTSIISAGRVEMEQDRARLFCHITQTWRSRPLVGRLAVVEPIAATTAKTGLRVERPLDTHSYEKGHQGQSTPKWKPPRHQRRHWTAPLV